MPQPRLFEDEVTPEPDVTDGLTLCDGSTSRSRHGVLSGLAIVGLIVALWFGLGPKYDVVKRGSLTLAGDQVGQLRPGATVTLDGTSVGKVDKVEFHGGMPSARLRIDPEVLKTIPGSSRFAVGSLNRVLPGNIGVKIITAGGSANDASPNADLESVRDRLADQSILPAHTPFGFYPVLFGLIVIGILALGVVIKILKSASFWTAILVALFIVVSFAWYTEQFQDAPSGRQEDLKAPQKAIQVFP